MSIFLAIYTFLNCIICILIGHLLSPGGPIVHIVLWIPGIVILITLSHLIKLTFPPLTTLYYLNLNPTLYNQSSQFVWISAWYLPPAYLVDRADLVDRALCNNISIDSVGGAGCVRPVPVQCCMRLVLASLSAFLPAASHREKKKKRKR